MPIEYCVFSSFVAVLSLGLVRLTATLVDPETGETWYVAPFRCSKIEESPRK